MGREDNDRTSFLERPELGDRYEARRRMYDARCAHCGKTSAEHPIGTCSNGKLFESLPYE